MPNQDSSDYIRKLKLSTIRNANGVTNSLKFRAPTKNNVYDPYRPSGAVSASVCIDICNRNTRHNLTNVMSLSYKTIPRIGRYPPS